VYVLNLSPPRSERPIGEGKTPSPSTTCVTILFLFPCDTVLL